MDHSWREVVIIVIVVAGPFISLFPKQVESWGGMRWVALILLGALFSGWEIIKDRSAEAFLARAEENLGQAEKKMEPDDPRRDDVRRLRRDIESLAEYGARRSERYNRIF